MAVTAQSKEIQMNEKDRARIVAQETAAFLNDGFGQLDLSGSPSLRTLPDQKFEPSDSEGLNNVAVSGSNHLKALADNPDPETISRIAEETGDPDLLHRITEAREVAEAQAFMAAHPSYYRDDDNYARIREWLDEHQLQFTSVNLATAFRALSASGDLLMRPGTAKSLTPNEQLHIISLCKNAQLDDAVAQYLDYSLPDAGDHWDNTTEFLSDPSTLKVRNDACKFVWFHSRPVQDTPAFREYEHVYFKHRPVRTVADYDDAYAAFQSHAKEIQRDRMIQGTEPKAPSVADLDDLSDDQVADLTHSSLQQRARQIIKARRR
jgi:hypothetical protein